jgi:hypothetical protein
MKIAFAAPASHPSPDSPKGTASIYGRACRGDARPAAERREPEGWSRFPDVWRSDIAWGL